MKKFPLYEKIQNSAKMTRKLTVTPNQTMFETTMKPNYSYVISEIDVI